MPIDGGNLGLFQVVVPTTYKVTNYVTNPSFELSTTGWAGTSATIGRTIGIGIFGAAAGVVNATAAGGVESYALPQLTVGQLGIVSVWVKADSSLVELRYIQDATIVTLAHPGDSKWHRLEVSATIISATTRLLQIRDMRSSTWTPIWVDGLQYEQTTLYTRASTYIDGDQDGCEWSGAAHASESTRNPRDGRGGLIVSFDELAVAVVGMPGIGAPPTNIGTQPLAISDGSIYSRMTYQERVLTLACKVFGNGTPASLHAARAVLLNAVNPNTRIKRGPTLLRYAGASVQKELLGYYEGGLEMERIEGADEEFALRFRAPNPYWRSITDESVAFVTNASLSGMNYLLQQNDEGAWDTVGGGINASVGGIVYALAEGRDKTVYAGGRWTGGPGGSAWLSIYRSGTWSGANGGNPNEEVDAIIVRPDGNIIVVGWFTSPGGGVALLDAAAETWTTPYGSITGLIGPSNAGLDGVGFLWVVGTGLSGGDTNKPVAFYYTGSAWSYPGGLGTTNGAAHCIVNGPDGYVYVGTDFGVYRGAFFAAFTQIAATNGAVRALAFGPDKRLYAGGDFTTIAGVSANYIARLNGTTWEALGSGIASPAGTLGVVNSMAFAENGKLYIVGGGTFYAGGNAKWSSIGGVQTTFSGAVWDGSSWGLIDVIPPANGSFEVGSRIIARQAGGIMLAYTGVGTATTPALTSCVNTGSADAYPVFRVNGSGWLYSIVNYTTKQRIHFSTLAVSAAPLIFDLRAGQKRAYSPYRDEMPYVLPSSDLDTFTLVPGANSIAVFTQIFSTADAFWRPQYWTAD